MQTVSLRFDGKRATKATSAGSHVKVEASYAISNPNVLKVLNVIDFGPKRNKGPKCNMS